MALKFTSATGIFSAASLDEGLETKLGLQGGTLSANNEFIEHGTWPADKSVLIIRRNGDVETAGIFEGSAALSGGTLIDGNILLTTVNFVPSDALARVWILTHKAFKDAIFIFLIVKLCRQA